MNVTTMCTQISDLISKYANKFALPAIPAIMLICAAIKRPGLSAMSIAASIISKQQSFGAPVGVNIDGSANMMNQLIYTAVNEVVDALKLNSKVEVGAQIGSISTIGTGANAGGTVTVTSQNILPIKFSGIIR